MVRPCRYGAGMIRICIAACSLTLLAACHQGHGAQGGAPGDPTSKSPFAGIADNDVVHFAGTEPFWDGEAAHGTLRWSSPENIEGVTFPVTRFAGRGGASFSGKLGDEPFTLMVTEAQCGDGMSDRKYPFTVSVEIGTDDLLTGCGWTDARRFSGGE
ncbi:MAG: hypothetical protein RLZZ08_619 [Pseudomonadota bacterium]|jgi:uncharacterized membrane protein